MTSIDAPALGASHHGRTFSSAPLPMTSIDAPALGASHHGRRFSVAPVQRPSIDAPALGAPHERAERSLREKSFGRSGWGGVALGRSAQRGHAA
jgi:hypothetical protein